ncbi:M61 family metallopeptidase [Sphingomonas fuzhouensis]|uniref:M61 family metallopeptidase n=1 Tax=Sphingomonas fuzhouensis TaxID=3106033 RepID=UPI002AFFF59D|nr:peptidase M61 [Sphingomonas sp. SGZ-02]
MIRHSLRSVFVASLLASTAAAVAQVPPGNSAPAAQAPFVNTIPAAVDTPYPGTIKLVVDATDTNRGIFRVKETIPVAKAGPMALLFPKWLPGAHSPRGEIEKLAGLVIRSNGRILPWTRDPVDVFAFHIDVPAGAQQLDLEFQFLSATKPDQGRIAVTPTMISLQPNSVSLYPAGYYTRQIPIQMTAIFPTGWTAAGAVPAKASGSTYTYDTTNYEILVDSPVLAGKYGKVFPLSPNVNLDVFADNPGELAATPEQIAAHKRLVEQAEKTFGSHHFDHYEFLLSISDQLGGIGLEHHRSSEDGVTPGYFTEWNSGPGRRNLLPHEFTHSWDGKFRRGADLWTPDYNTPMRDSLLWVYEGQTQFWGYVLQARSGLVSKQDTLDQYASILAYYANSKGREWRDLVDTTNDPIISSRKPKGWTSWQRSEDYYNEGLMVWMEVDAMLRQKSGGTKSLDDFAKAFFGIRNGDWGEVLYNFNDVADTLNKIVPYDWAGFLTKRLTETGQPAPIDGFAMNGYKLVYTDQPTAVFKQSEKGRTDVSYSLGMVVSNGGDVTSSIWDSPAFKAGIDVGTQIQAVNGESYTGERLKAAILAAKDPNKPVKLVIKNQDVFRDVTLDYTGGPRYPHLQKVGTGETGLDRLLTAR